MQRMKDGDWICENCKDHQFARNIKCRQCGHPRPKHLENSRGVQRAVKPGDWYCEVCSGHQFANRTTCRDCGAPKTSSKISSNTGSKTGLKTQKPSKPLKQLHKDNKKYYMVIDFEANCSSERDRDHEIIEFPAVLVEATSGKTVSEFHHYVKMVTHQKLSDFIKNLTHITDEQAQNGLEWTQCLAEFEKWCVSHNVTPQNTTVVTCGDWDLRSMLDRQLTITKTKLTEFVNELFGCWTNIKKYYGVAMQVPATGMDGMLKSLNLQLDGHHHSGIDDSRNIAKICHEMTKRGYDVTTPTSLRKDKLWYNGKMYYKINKKGLIIPANKIVKS